LVDISVDAVENRVECAHVQLRRGKPDWETGRSMRDLYILILARLFGNRWNANKVPCDVYLKFYDQTNGQECILQRLDGIQCRNL
jgi:hypothetical protein